MSAHTPGPWFASSAGVTTPGGIVVCEAPIHYLGSAEQWQDNARLIAAAPDLFAALVSLAAVARRYLPDYDEHPEVQTADAAINKATGGGE